MKPPAKKNRRKAAAPVPSPPRPAGDDLGIFDEDEVYQREPWRGEEWIPAEDRYSELLAGHLPQTKHAALVHFNAAWCWSCLGWGDPQQHLERLAVAMKQAMLSKDESLFFDLAKLAKACFRHPWQTNEELVLSVAFELREDGCENPTREAVKKAVQARLAKQGQIDEKDWSGYFKRCCLEFLEKSRPGRKPNPPATTKPSRRPMK